MYVEDDELTQCRTPAEVLSFMEAAAPLTGVRVVRGSLAERRVPLRVLLGDFLGRHLSRGSQCRIGMHVPVMKAGPTWGCHYCKKEF